MRKIFIYISNRHEQILRALIILISVAGIVAMLPHKVLTGIKEYSAGTLWHADDLIAPFDFPIRKTPDSLRAEQEMIKWQSPLCLRYDSAVKNDVIENYTQIFESEWRADVSDDAADVSFDKDKTYHTGLKLLESWYSRGIISIDTTFTHGRTENLILVTGSASYRPVSMREYHVAGELRNTLDAYLVAEERVDKDFLILLFDRILRADIVYDHSLTSSFQQDRLDDISPVFGLVKKGDLIIAKNTVIDKETSNIIRSLDLRLKQQSEAKADNNILYAGFLSLTLIAVSVMILFLWMLRRETLLSNRKLTLVFINIILIVFFFTKILKISAISTYLVPCCILPIVVRAFFDTRLALFVHVITSLILGSVAPSGFEFVFMQITAGMVAVFSIVNMRMRSQLFITVALIFSVYVLSYLSLRIISSGSFASIELADMAWMFGNALLTLFAYPLIYIFEKLFGLISDVRLLELSDLNSVLLRDLSVKAPGTFQHSLQVANLSEAAIYKIGGNSLMVRVGALYHDIGKMDMPLYFIENQSTQVNPHDELSFEESAHIIISHVIKGIEKARRFKLPDQIIDFIRTHHGTTMVQYFYQSYLKNFPETIPAESDFQYPGPLPYSRETAVLMMADSVEAASRSLHVHDADTLNSLVDSIIEDQTKQQQFVNADITFRDINEIKTIFKKMLMSMYHVRVEYASV